MSFIFVSIYISCFSRLPQIRYLFTLRHFRPYSKEKVHRAGVHHQTSSRSPPYAFQSRFAASPNERDTLLVDEGEEEQEASGGGAAEDVEAAIFGNINLSPGAATVAVAKF